MRTPTLHIVLLQAIAALILFINTGCKDAREASDVRNMCRAYDAACRNQNAEEAMAMMSSQSFQYYDRLVQHARTLKLDGIRQLPLGEQLYVVCIRSTLTPEELRTVDGRGYIKLAIERGRWTESEGDPTEYMGLVKVRKDVATAKALDLKGKPLRYSFYFIKEGDAWKQDFSKGREIATYWVEKYASIFDSSHEAAVCSMAGAPFELFVGPPK